MSYRIKSVASLTGINSATLRAWERRYHLVSPHRTQGGYRVYSDEDVATISRVKALVDRGLKVGEAIAIVRRGDPVPSVPEVAQSTDEIRTGMLEALLSFDRATADRLYDRLAALSFTEQVEEVLMPLMRDLGDLWAQGKAEVTHEHFASAFVREKLSWMLGFLSTAPEQRREAVCAGVPGEEHELGLMAVAVHLAAAGWHVTYLGLDVPLADLRRTLEARRPVLLCSSVILGRPEAECHALGMRLREAAPLGTQVLLGGAGIPESLLGVPVDGLALVRDVAQACRLLTAGRA